jgi:hypothetical protein
MILARTAVAVQARERPLDDPASRPDLERLLTLAADPQLQDPALDLLGALRNVTVVDPISQEIHS